MPGRLAPELWLALLALGCQSTARAERSASPSTSASVTVAPRAASSFELENGVFVQRHPRLPDSGEWRCAERGGVVWCAGGQAPAGVAPGRPDPAFRCGQRWGADAPSERVCIDRRPEYPSSGARQCRFEQERGIQRSCRTAASEAAPELDARVVPACWLDRDCPTGRCDRGSCRCDAERDCQSGRCEAGHCREAAR